MKESANLNTKHKLLQAFKILKQNYSKTELSYHSTDKYYWHVAILHVIVLHSSIIRELIEHDIRFAVIANHNHIVLEL